jgi:hypothetical protein
MDGQTELPVTEFEGALQDLEGLTRNEIVAVVLACVDRDVALAFATLTESLSLETLRLLSARALLAATSHRRPTLAWVAPGLEPPRPRWGRAVQRSEHARQAHPHMSLSKATDVPAFPGAPGLPSTPVVSAPALPCPPPGPAAPPAPGAPSRVF